MKITQAKCLYADGGWRPFCFLKMETDEGLTGWSEFTRGWWSPGHGSVVEGMCSRIIGRDPRSFAALSAELHAGVSFAAGGQNAQAIAAIENACVDLAAKAAAVPAAQLLGGPFRDELRLYWSHCGSFRAPHAEFFEKVLGRPALRSIGDFKLLGREAVERGFSAAKINPIAFHDGLPSLLNPGFTPGADPGHVIDRVTMHAILAQLEAFRDGAGAHFEILLDINFGFSASAAARLADELSGIGLKWLEADMAAPKALASLHRRLDVPLASLEHIYGRKGMLPYLEADAVDVAVIDIPWNGIVEGMRMASLAETYGVNVAPHNFYGPLADLMSAHFCAAVPNFEIMEIEGDDVPWKSSLLTAAPDISIGRFKLPDVPGWGADVNEAAVAEYPWKGAL